ncbi:MAG: polynucleotide adenylyltransferase PcnB [Betaproteobacteria bacterium]|nr:polynucleotide adenylyltransferase PcnB [Betaproteobacteria bacterium]
MIRSLLSRLIPGRRAREPRIYSSAQHDLRRDSVSRGAAQVVDRLQEAGYRAFIVGGAVRDLLLGQRPKDFDIATNATPEQVKPLFRRAFIIGRRFRLVHVHVGGETIEVSTFRGPQNGASADEHGRILSDNVFGTQAEDAARRDFTINALYFDPVTEEIWDYLDGYKDILAHRLRLIGGPVTRYREDPVRMLRAVRLAAKLGCQIEAKTNAPIAKLAPLIQNVPAARLFEEMQKLLLSGHATESLQALRAHGLHHGLLPLLDVIMEQPLGSRFIDLALANTDARVREGKPVSPGFLFATLLWHETLAAWNARKQAGESPISALHEAMDQVLDSQAEKIAIPRRFGADIKEIWGLQPRFEQRSGRRPFRLLEQPRFRAGFDFLVLRAASGEVPEELGTWWQDFQDAHPAEREQMLVADESPPKRRRRRRGRGRGAGAAQEDGPDSAGGGAGEGGEP